jgi:DNA processing protein
MCTRRGKERAQQVGEKIAQAGGLVISGAAYGIDGAAQWAALEAGGASFAVLGCGVDIGYPSGNAQLFERLAGEGGILSEFPPGTPPLQHHFPMRNRIISGLSDLVLVIEARRRSGSLITADFAAEQGRSVVAVPGRPEDELSEGCNELITQGAGVFLSTELFLLSVFPENKAQKKQMSDALLLAPTEKLVYSSLGLHSKSLWELEVCTVLSLAELSECLLSLEMKGLVKETERGYYARKE